MVVVLQKIINIMGQNLCDVDREQIDTVKLELERQHPVKSLAQQPLPHDPDAIQIREVSPITVSHEPRSNFAKAVDYTP